jgi:hypothetical protein
VSEFERDLLFHRDLCLARVIDLCCYREIYDLQTDYLEGLHDERAYILKRDDIYDAYRVAGYDNAQ